MYICFDMLFLLIGFFYSSDLGDSPVGNIYIYIYIYM